MKRVVVRYKVKPDRADENVKLIKAVFAELKAKTPDGVRYASFHDETGLAFTHIASIETGDGSNPLAALEAFRAFTKDIAERCEEPPQATALTQVGGYRLLEPGE